MASHYQYCSVPLTEFLSEECTLDFSKKEKPKKRSFLGKTETHYQVILLKRNSYPILDKIFTIQ